MEAKALEEKGGTQQKMNEDFTSKLNSLQVTDFVGLFPTLIAYLVAQTSCFKSGRLAQFIPAWQQTIWQQITSDTEILQVVSGQYIEFSTQASQTHPPPGKRFGGEEQVIITSEISNLLEKAVIVETIHEPGEFISSVFVRRKKDGSHRMILNLKNLNKHVQYNHFKVDTLQSVLNSMRPKRFMDSIDLKDAYYCVPIVPSHQKCLKFEGDGRLYQFTCFPNGLVIGQNEASLRYFETALNMWTPLIVMILTFKVEIIMSA